MDWVAVVVDEVVEGVTQGTSGGECYGTYDSTSGTGSGAGYVNACIHSGTIAAENTYDGIATNTVWYNYAVATAGTIVETSTTANATDTTLATQSICPKGWTLPTSRQMHVIGPAYPASSSTTYIADFSPIKGGNYYAGTLYYESTYGLWWGSEAFNGAVREELYYTSYGFTTRNYYRDSGQYIRCVSEEKDVSDLTYMQDMTPSVAANTAEGALAVILKNHKIWYNSIKDRIQLVIFV